MEAGRFAGVEVDDQTVGVAGPAVATDRPLVHVELERGEVHHPGEGGQVVDDRERELAIALARPAARGGHRCGADPRRGAVGGVLLEEAQVLDPVRPADPGHRPVLEVGQHHRRDRRVVVEHLALGGAGARIEHLAQAADLQGPALDVDEDLLLVVGLLFGIRDPRRNQVGADSAVGRLPEPLVAPSVGVHVDDQHRLDPVGAAARPRGAPRRRTGCSVPRQRRDQLGQLPGGLAADPAADPAAVEQALRRQLPHQQRCQPVGRALLWSPAADHVGQPVPVRELQPVLAPLAEGVARRPSLADDALEPLLERRAVEHRPVVVRRRHLPGAVAASGSVSRARRLSSGSS